MALASAFQIAPTTLRWEHRERWAHSGRWCWTVGGMLQGMQGKQGMKGMKGMQVMPIGSSLLRLATGNRLCFVLSNIHGMTAVYVEHRYIRRTMYSMLMVMMRLAPARVRHRLRTHPLT